MKMKVVQCWDDGVSADLRRVELLRKHGAKTTFNLNVGRHGTQRGGRWEYKGTEVLRLARAELLPAYEGFFIANHTVNHPWLDRIPLDEARREIEDGRKGLQDLFQQPVEGFAYPFGSYNQEVMDLLREAGHIYARTTEAVASALPVEDSMAFHPNCHFLEADFWERYERARASGVFYFWGHSYELITPEMWTDFEEKIRRITADDQAEWADVQDLFPQSAD